MTRPPLRLLLVDDHPVVLEGLAAVFADEADLAIVAKARSAAQAVALHATERPDVTVLDVRLGADDGIAVLRRLRAGDPHTRVLVLSTFDTDQEVGEAVDAGAAGYLLKTAPPEVLVDAVRRVAAGLRVLPPAIAARLSSRREFAELSAREGQILALLAEGAGNREIADRLSIREATVKEHLTHVYTKLGVASRTQAIAQALARGLVRRRPD